MAADSRIKIVIAGDAKSAEEAFRQAKAAAETTMKATAAAVAAAAGSFALIEGKVLGVASEFERYQTQLDTIEGSSSAARASMQWITDFTAKTPFELNQVTDAFVKLKAFGIDPLANDALRTLGDTAAAMGKPLNQAVEALADAATGEFERLKEFGIKARTVGEQVLFNYTQNGEQMVASADKNSQEMLQSTLLGIWNDKYAGGMDKLSQTWDGMVSNMSDQWTIFQKQIGDDGAFKAAKNALALVLDEVQKNDAEVKALAQNISDGLVTSMEIGAEAAALSAKGFVAFGSVMDGVRVGIDAVSLAAVEGFDVMLGALQSLYDGLAMLPGSLGEPYAMASADIQKFRNDLSHLEQGIRQTGGESMNTLVGGLDEAAASFDKIDRKAVKFFSALESGRQTVAAGIDAGIQGEVKKPGTQSGGESPEVIKAREDAKKVIDIHSWKWQQIEIMSQVAFASEEDRLLAQQEVKFARLDEERQRMIDAVSLQVQDEEERRIKLQQINDYYDGLKVQTAEQTADRLYKITKQSADAELKIERLKAQAKLKTAHQVFGDIATLMNTGNRRMFEIGKAAAIANTIVSTYEGAQEAFTNAEKTGVPGLGFVAAAAAVAAGIARVKAIASTNFQSKSAGVAAGGGTPNVGGGGIGIGGGVGRTAPTGQSQQPQPTNVTIIAQTLDPSQLTPDVMQRIGDSLAPHINNANQRGLQNTVVV